ncbi:hypothetical protein RI844_15485 [Thalassotalea fonticola]|uniref:Uncharacterized protein n=1 Tax=Thalassotalea fonticola TaxID=3065649 RepID=A0ABZ0GM42_9GAMM|nr:hypothetical protein RI844_15485 [Colwelliaceae bacterium S1-1]
MNTVNHQGVDTTPAVPNSKNRNSKQYALITLGVVAITIGFLTICFGSYWSTPIFAFMTNIGINSSFEVVVPFLSIFIIMLGAYLIVKSRH